MRLLAKLVCCLFIWAGVVSANPPFDPDDLIFHFRGPEKTSGIGITITPVGDINADGFDDIAISCLVPSDTYIF
jgi:hypothetical protein